MKRVTFIARKTTKTDKRLATAARMWYKDGNQMSTFLKFLTFKKSYQVRCIANGLEGWNDASSAFEYPRQILKLCIGMAKDVSWRRNNMNITARDILANLSHSEMTDVISNAAMRLQSALRAVAIAKHLGYRGTLSIKLVTTESKLEFEDGSSLPLNRLLLKQVQIDDIQAKVAEFIAEQGIRTRG